MSLSLHQLGLYITSPHMWPWPASVASRYPLSLTHGCASVLGCLLSVTPALFFEFQKQNHSHHLYSGTQSHTSQRCFVTTHCLYTAGPSGWLASGHPSHLSTCENTLSDVCTMMESPNNALLGMFPHPSVTSDTLMFVIGDILPQGVRDWCICV